MGKRHVLVTAVLVGALAGAFVWADDPAKPVAKPQATMLVEDLNQAILDIQQAKSLLPADQTVAIGKLDSALKTLQAVQAATTQPASQPAPTPAPTLAPTGAPTPAATPAAGVGTFSGSVYATKTRKQPRIKVDGTIYDLKASDKATDAVKDTLDKISKGQTGDFVVKGTVKGNELFVDSISAK